jgi:hypothetical protein
MMTPLYSPIVSSILQEWMDTISTNELSDVEIDTEFIEAISIMINESKINSASEIKRVIESLEIKYAAQDK